MGSVFEAVHRESGDKFALKALPERFYQDKRKALYLKRELEIARSLDHPNVVRIYDIVETDSSEGRGYMVMELVEGENLKEILQSRCLTPLEGIEICIKICSGLNYIHNHRLQDGKFHSIVHRDIKPANIILTPKGQLKIVDFGLATSEASWWKLWLKVKARSGTPQYMAPEQIMGKKVDARADIYSLGVTMYELFSGRLPFQGQNKKEIMKQHLSSKYKPERPSSINKNLPPALDRLVLKAMARRPKGRYQTVAALLLDLQRLLPKHMY